MTRKRFAVCMLLALVTVHGVDVTAGRLPRAAQTAKRVPADRPVPRTDANSKLAHQQLVEKASRGGIDVYFLGDSIVRRWGATDYPELLENWRANFFGWNAGN